MATQLRHRQVKVTAIQHPDGTIEVPIAVHADHLAGDGTIRLRPDQDGYDEAAAHAIDADEHPLARPRDLTLAAQLEAMFTRRDQRRTA